MSSGKTGKNIFFLTADLPICFEAFNAYTERLEADKRRINSALSQIEIQLLSSAGSQAPSWLPQSFHAEKLKPTILFC